MKYLAGALLILSLFGCARETVTPPAPALQDLRGQWVVINYWAQWCKPCIEEIPQLNKLDHEFSQVTVLGVNYDGASGSDLEKQRQALGVDFASMPEDPAAQLGTPRPVVLPTTLILDPAGKLVATLVGPQTFESLAVATKQAAGQPAGQ